MGQLEDAANAQSVFARAGLRRRANLKKLADDVVDFELLALEAERRGLGRAKTVGRQTDERAIEALLQREIDSRITPESITVAEIAAHYKAHHADFARPELVRASHILVDTEAAALELRKQLDRAPSQDFRRLAKEKSLDPETSSRGGDLLFFGVDGRAPGAADASVNPALVHAAFALREIGNLSPPVAVGQRWSIVRLTGRQPAREPSVEEVSPIIRKTLWQERRRAAIVEFLGALTKRVGPRVKLDGADKVVLDSTANIPGFAGQKASSAGASSASPTAPAAPASPSGAPSKTPAKPPPSTQTP